jgi:hypothetical protein
VKEDGTKGAFISARLAWKFCARLVWKGWREVGRGFEGGVMSKDKHRQENDKRRKRKYIAGRVFRYCRYRTRISLFGSFLLSANPRIFDCGIIYLAHCVCFFMFLFCVPSFRNYWFLLVGRLRCT